MLDWTEIVLPIVGFLTGLISLIVSYVQTRKVTKLQSELNSRIHFTNIQYEKEYQICQNVWELFIPFHELSVSYGNKSILILENLFLNYDEINREMDKFQKEVKKFNEYISKLEPFFDKRIYEEVDYICVCADGFLKNTRMFLNHKIYDGESDSSNKGYLYDDFKEYQTDMIKKFIERKIKFSEIIRNYLNSVKIS